MKTNGREMHGDLYINGVMVRENELHEPKVEIRFTDQHPTGLAVAQCAVCHAILDECSFTGNGYTVRYGNYCPICDARLKEVE